jgi:uncharacterized protein (DUF433 family)
MDGGDLFSLREAAVLSRLPEGRVRREIEHGVITYRPAKVGSAQRHQFTEGDILYFALLYHLHDSLDLPRPTRSAVHRLIFLDNFIVAGWRRPEVCRLRGQGTAEFTPRNLIISLASTDQALRHEIAGTLAEAWCRNISQVYTVNWDRLLDDVGPRVCIYRRGCSRITKDAAVLGGEPVFEGTRIAVRHIGGMLEKGEPAEQILEDYPRLSKEDVEFAALYAAANPLVGRPKSRDVGATDDP